MTLSSLEEILQDGKNKHMRRNTERASAVTKIDDHVHISYK